MDKKIYYNELYDCYKELLTEKQQEYYENYYFEDYSLSEIAENESVTRNAVHNQIKIVLEKLDFYEAHLHIRKNTLEIRKIIKDLNPDVKEKIEKYL